MTTLNLRGGTYTVVSDAPGFAEKMLRIEAPASRSRRSSSSPPLPRRSTRTKPAKLSFTGWENRPALHLTSATECRAYRPSTDSVHMPVRSRFVDAPHYYSTLFHELVHSTGHESRLNRTFGDHFGDELYSKEELVVEMGAAFLCAIAEIAKEHTDRNTTAYIQNWISKLEEDNRLIVHAAANAQRAVDSILGTTFAEETEGDAANPAAFETPIPSGTTEELAEVA